MTDTNTETWAAEEFKALDLGHRWRNDRWLKMAARACAEPSGRITECFEKGATRQAAYKLLEGGAARPCRVVAAAAQAALLRAWGPYIVAPIDQCTLTLSASNAEKAFGRVGRSDLHCFGAESMHSIAVTADGVPLGLLAQTMWTRTEPARARHVSTRALPLGEKETRHWVDVAQAAHAAWRESGLEAPLWFQLDAGGDAREVLQHLFGLKDAHVTVRCRRDRRLEWPEPEFLSETLARAAVVGRMQVEVFDAHRRNPRRAQLEVRALPVVLRLKHPGTKQESPLTCYAVEAREVSCPEGEEPIAWVLLTTRPASTFTAAREVVSAYALRWRIEEVHRTWKTGCKVESSGLGFAAFQPWAALLLCVAVRTERLKRLSREQPQSPAAAEFTEDELRALTLVSPRAKRRSNAASPPTLGEAVLWLAELGGYMGPTPSRGPPGSIVIRRGLDKLATYADALRLIREADK